VGIHAQADVHPYTGRWMSQSASALVTRKTGDTTGGQRVRAADLLLPGLAVQL